MFGFWSGRWQAINNLILSLTPYLVLKSRQKQIIKIRRREGEGNFFWKREISMLMQEIKCICLKLGETNRSVPTQHDLFIKRVT